MLWRDLPIDGAARGVHDQTNPRLCAGVQDVDRSANVDIRVEQRRMQRRGETCLGRKMDHDVRSPPRDRVGAVGATHITDTDVAIGQPTGERVSQLLDSARGQIVDDLDVNPGIEQPRDDVAADEARTTGDGNTSPAQHSSGTKPDGLVYSVHTLLPFHSKHCLRVIQLLCVEAHPVEPAYGQVRPERVHQVSHPAGGVVAGRVRFAVACVATVPYRW